MFWAKNEAIYWLLQAGRTSQQSLNYLEEHLAVTKLCNFELQV